ncbi:MAG: hypothetical protein RMY33_011195 [Nostoc sp. DedQUE03]|nr:hypothetical protein [Nostoc sp. DedQUE02]
MEKATLFRGLSTYREKSDNLTTNLIETAVVRKIDVSANLKCFHIEKHL